jgi:hypothetical protein
MPADSRRPHDAAPIAEASVWLNRAFSIVLQMIVPGLAGYWLDQRWGTQVLALVGGGRGLALAVWSLTRLAQTSELASRRSRAPRGSGPDGPLDQSPPGGSPPPSFNPPAS